MYHNTARHNSTSLRARSSSTPVLRRFSLGSMARRLCDSPPPYSSSSPYRSTCASPSRILFTFLYLYFVLYICYFILYIFCARRRLHHYIALCRTLHCRAMHM